MLRVRTVFTGPVGAPWLSTAFFDSSDGGDAPGATARVAAFWGTLSEVQHTSVHYQVQPEVAIMTNAGVLTGIAAGTESSGVGSGSGDVMPWAAQGLVRWHTNVFSAGREVAGKTFLPGLVTSLATDGVLNAGAMTLIETAAASLLASDSPAFAIWSRKHSTINDVVAGGVDSAIAVLRSRRD